MTSPASHDGESCTNHVTAFLDHLQGVRKRGRGWRACCPAHIDTKPSLDIDIGDDGRILLICRSAGCTVEAIVAAVHLTLADLYPSAGPSAGRTRARTNRRKDDVFASVDEAVRVACGAAQFGGSWTYHGADGGDAMLIVRRNLANGSKDFRQLHPVAGGWSFGAPEGLRPLYQLPLLQERRTEHVFVVEGEKCADAVLGLGLLATTSSGGASSPHHSEWSVLANHIVTIIVDNDEPGRAYGKRVAKLILAKTPRAKVLILELPGLPEHGDVVDWIAKQRGEGQEDRTIAECLAMLEGTPVDDEPASGSDDAESTPTVEPVMRCLADVEATEVEWLWKDRIPLGRLTLIVGAPGSGKSYATCDIAARVTTGRSFPDGAACVPGDVILITCEDDAADTIRPRLDALDADVSRVHLLDGVRHKVKGKQRESMFTLQDVAALEQALRSHPRCRAVVVDPIGSYLGSNVDSYRDNEVRSVLAPIAALANKHKVAIIVVMHSRKGFADRADTLALGSVAFPGISRAVWHVFKEKRNPTRRLFLAGKQNLSPESDGLAFRIEHDGRVGKLEWEPAPVKMNADDALHDERVAGEPKPGPAPELREEAQAWLIELLGNESLPAAGVKKEAAAAGLAWRTVQRAAQFLGIKPTKRFDGGWTWKLPPGDGDEP